MVNHSAISAASRAELAARNRPVADSSHAATSSGVPVTTTRPPSSAAPGPRSISPVGRLHELQVVLDDDQRMADVQQRVEAIQQLYDVGKVQAGRRLVEQEQRPAAALGGQVGGQLEPLGLAAGERGGRLAEPQVIEPDVEQLLQLAPAPCAGRERR